jgi:hypothetical protein
MGMVANNVATMSSVKTNIGSGETYQELTDFRNLGSAGISNVAGINGFIVEAGTIRLTDLMDATKANLRANIYLQGTAYQYASGSSGVTLTVRFKANGSLELTTFINGDSGASSGTGNLSFSGAGTVSQDYTREWLYLNSSPVLSSTANNWQIKLTKTAGTESAPTNNNTWVAFPHDVNISVARSSDGISTGSLTCNVQIRRTDNQIVVENSSIRLEGSATTDPDAPP